MAQELGTKNIEEVLSALKIGSIKILQAVAKDGFQWPDLLAFMQSKEFEDALKPALEDIHLALDEAADIGFQDGLRLAKFGYSLVGDLITEMKLASQKLKEEVKE